ncbi:hypothetical protein CEXT_199411 [Caerostris extrusa]|uniref:Uncharacterized protein n=1 Tax=Caerostris extrusa TaxID=172846 RepID=A0AAV4WT99_CAEEX|nr:hypothetical protein CEXT_199411 [Caerostris extrusa]
MERRQKTSSNGLREKNPNGRKRNHLPMQDGIQAYFPTVMTGRKTLDFLPEMEQRQKDVLEWSPRKKESER